MLLVGKDIRKLDKLKKDLSKSFDMKDLSVEENLEHGSQG